MVMRLLAPREVLGAVVRDAAADVDGGHRHTSGEQRASLEREATNAQRYDVAADDGGPQVVREAVSADRRKRTAVRQHVDRVPWSAASVGAVEVQLSAKYGVHGGIAGPWM